MNDFIATNFLLTGSMQSVQKTVISIKFFIPIIDFERSIRTMKTLLLFLSCIIFISQFYGQPFSIAGFFEDSETLEPVYVNFEFYKGDTLLMKRSGYTDQAFKIKNLEKGMYSFLYQNRFYQNFRYEILIDGNLEDHRIPYYRFYYEDRQEDYQPGSLLMPSESLPIGETISYEFKTSGCFHFSHLRINIKKEKGFYFAQYIINRRLRNLDGTLQLDDSAYPKLQLDSVVAEKKLAQSDLDSFSRFEQEMWRAYRFQFEQDKLTGGGISTTHNYFTFRRNDDEIHFELCIGNPEDTLREWVKEIFGRELFGENMQFLERIKD
ncbi:MAG: hypothetical protein KDE26_26155 [Bacteroidetes bacterium]|nr:hypothetical protein [Bacteroidota bacterium]